MANQIFVGKQGFSISDVIIALRSTPAFFLLPGKWLDVARDLQVPPNKITKIQQDFALDRVTLSDTVQTVLENWTEMNPDNATLNELILELENNGLRECADSLQTEFLPDSLNKFKYLPSDLDEFIGKSSKRMCIISTVDCSITYEKIREHQRLSIRHNSESIIQAISANTISIDHLHVVTHCDMDTVRKLIFNVLGYKRIHFPKLIVVTTENDAELQDFVNDYPYLRNKIHICRDTIKWNDLTLGHQRTIKGIIREKFASDSDPFQYHNELFSEQQLVDLINGKSLKLFANTIPASPSYYVDRKITTQHVISSEIFDKVYQDVFMFKNLKRYELSSLVKTRLTDCSNNQVLLRRSDVAFISLDEESHFEHICQTEMAPVHLLRYEGTFPGGRLIWEKSFGELASLQNHIDRTSYAMKVDDLLEMLSSSLNTPICISGCPGMGKSTLLVQIGDCLSKKYPDRTVIFVKASDFSSKYKGLDISDNSLDNVTRDLICTNDLERSWLMSNFSSKSVKVELLLSGFDDIPTSDFNFGLELLNRYKSYKFIRLWLTTRPCVLAKLENKLNALAHTIVPLDEKDQLSFLVGYWNQGTNLNKPLLKQFADSCLMELKSKLKGLSDDIGGIPFHCQELAELLDKDAKTFAQLGGDVTVPQFSIGSLYHKLIKKRLEFWQHENNEQDHTKIMHIHVQLSLAFLFPRISKRSEDIFDLDKWLTSDKILQIGFVESKNPLKFFHHSFASYFVAWGLFNDFVKQPVSELASKIVSMMPQDGPHRHLVYEFLDSLIESNGQVESLVIQPNGRLLRGDKVTIKEIAHLCINQNYPNIFSMFNAVSAFKNDTRSIFTRELILSSFKLSSLDFIKLIIQHFEKNYIFDTDLQRETLQISVRRGNFGMVEYLLKEKIGQKADIIAAFVGNILGDCIRNSKQNPKSQLSERIAIIGTLVSINPLLLEMKDEDDNTPLLTPSSHVLLLTELLQMGGNPRAQNKMMDTILHPSDAQQGLTGQDYNQIMLNIRDDDLQRLVHLKGNNDDTPLLRLIKVSEPTPDTIHKFTQAQADFNCVDKNGFSVLANAIIEKRSLNTLELLIDNGASINWKGAKHEGLLHLATQMGEIHSIHLLLSFGVKVNGRDENGNTPLHLAMEHVHSDNFGIVQLLLNHGADPNIINIDKKVPLHVGLENERINPETLRLLKIKTERNILIGNAGDLKMKHRRIDVNSSGSLAFGTMTTAYNEEEPMQVDISPNTRNQATSTNTGQEALLHKAALSTDKETSLDIIQDLVLSGTNAYSKDASNATFLHRFLGTGKTTPFHLHSITEFLLARDLAGLFSTPGGDSQATPLHLAVNVTEPKEPTLHLLFSHGVNFNSHDKQGDTILAYAVKGGRGAKTLSALISCDVEYRTNKHGDSLLHIAAAFGTMSALEFLLGQSRLDINATNNLGNTPLHYALHLKNNMDLLAKCKKLVSMGADVNIRNAEGNSPLSLINSLDDNVKGELLGLLAA